MDFSLLLSFRRDYQRVTGGFVDRFVSAMSTVTGAGSIEDMWDIRARILAMDIWTKGSITGIALGSLTGTYIGTSSLR